MIIDDNGYKGLQSELGYLDEVAEKIGFIRWQWENYRATYDYEIQHGEDTYYLRVNTRAVEGMLESPRAVLEIEVAYVGRATYPLGLEYDDPIPAPVLKASQVKLNELKAKLS